MKTKIVMNKLFVFTFSLMLCGASYAQLIVNQTGKVSVGTEEEALSNFSVGGAGSTYSNAYINQNAGNGLTIKNKVRSFNNPNQGLRVELNTISHQAEGVLAEITGNNSNHVRAIEGRACGGEYNVGVWGALEHTYEMTSGAGVFGALTGYPITFNGVYAGYFYGDVKVTGGIDGVLLSSASSSASSPTYSMMHEGEEQGILDKLQDIDLLQIDKREMPDFRNEEEDIPGMTRIHEVGYGLAADQLEKVFPELVYKDANGNTSINYVEMVPLLVQSINELQQKINILEGERGVKQVAKKEGLATGKDGLSEALSLSQNIPNPFHESTTITLTLPSTTVNADLCIYDLTGKQIRKVRVNDRGEVHMAITAEGLTPGMYIYALIADGQVISSKRMIFE